MSYELRAPCELLMRQPRKQLPRTNRKPRGAHATELAALDPASVVGSRSTTSYHPNANAIMRGPKQHENVLVLGRPRGWRHGQGAKGARGLLVTKLHGVKTKFRPLADDLFIGFAFPGMGTSGGESTR